MIREWGPNWSNRICRQVINLDRISSAVRDRPLTISDNKTASNALNLAIMAFATQWSQSSERRRSKSRKIDSEGCVIETPENVYSRDGAENTQRSSGLRPHLDRTMQHSFWEQARQAIQDATQIESFRVVFAHIIFALTQKPVDRDQHSPSSGSRDRNPRPKTREAMLKRTHHCHNLPRQEEHTATGWQDLEDHRKTGGRTRTGD